MQQILWAEIFLKAVAGAVLVIAPLTVISLVGLQRPETGFWPRLLGAVTLAVAAGIWVGLQFPSAQGPIGPAGLIPINLFAAAALIAPLVLGKAAPSRRGKLFIAATAVLLLALAFLEIAHV
ncbi:MAG TPA: ABC transporter permease [Hyphomicrobium sp.]